MFIHIKGNQANIYRFGIGEEIYILKHYYKWENNEALILSKLSHPNIIKLQTSGLINGEQCVIMNYFEGKPLDKINNKISTQLDSVLSYFKKIGLKHRDLNPTSILVDGEDEIKIIDFGWASMPNIPLRQIVPPTINGYYSSDDDKAVEMLKEKFK